MLSDDSRKKIVYFITKANLGGAQKYVLDLALSLPKDKFDVLVISGNGDWLFEQLEKNNIRYIKLEKLKRDIGFIGEIKSIWQLYKILKKERPLILHLNSSKAGILGSVVGRVLNIKKIIFTAHGWAFNEKERSFFSKTFIYFLHFLTVFLSDKTIAVSKKTKLDISHTKFIKNKIELVYNSIKSFDILDRETSRDILFQKYNIPKNCYLIGTISELNKNKGLDIMINSLKEINDLLYKFIIIGEGEEKNNLMNLCEKNNLTDKIVFLGKIENAKNYLKACDLFTLTSRTEALPYVILEAGLAGIPILATRVGGIPEIIDNEIDGLLCLPTQESVLEGLKYVLKYPDKIKEFGLKLKDKIEKNFVLDKMVNKTIDIYLQK